MSKCTIIVGRTGSGKTTIVKKLISAHKKKNPKGQRLIYDVNNEYGERYMPMDEFLSAAKAATRTLIVFEEATIFFSTSGGQIEMRELLVRKRHTKNYFVFNFHSLSQVPLYILMFCDTMIIKKTNDQIPQIERKYKGNSRVIKAYCQVANSPDKYATEVIRP